MALILRNLEREFERAKNKQARLRERASSGRMSIPAGFVHYSSKGKSVGNAFRSPFSGLEEVGGGIRHLGAADMLTKEPQIRNPLLQPFNFYLPQSRFEMNKWLTYMYQFNPLFGSIIDIHAELPLSRFAITGVEDPSILKIYETVSENLDLFTNLMKMMRLYWLFGEVVPYCFWDDNLNCFGSTTQIPSEDVEVFAHYLAFSPEGKDLRRFELIPDNILKQFVNSTNPQDIEIREYLDPEIVSAVAGGKNIILDNYSTDLLARTVLPSSSSENLRGIPIGLRVLKDLIYEDKLREAQFMIAEGHITPTKIWKIGQAGEYGFMPDEDYLEDFRDLLLQAEDDPLFGIITHYAVNLEVVGSEGRMMKLDGELDRIEKRVLTGLMANRALVSGEGATYQNASVALRILMSRYIPIRNMLENWMIWKVFAPIAYANGYYKITKAELAHGVRKSKASRELVLPRINWRSKANLLDDANTKSLLLTLRNNLEIPMKTVCESLDLDYKSVKKFLAEEQGTILDPTVRGMRKNMLAGISQKYVGPFKKIWKLLKSLTPFEDTDEGDRESEKEPQAQLSEVVPPQKDEEKDVKKDDLWKTPTEKVEGQDGPETTKTPSPENAPDKGVSKEPGEPNVRESFYQKKEGKLKSDFARKKKGKFLDLDGLVDSEDT